MANRDLALLDPVFRQRLARVMERMEKEAGYRVELVEGYRSPERQEALFRQGRTEPGQVVTWTRNSLHSRGRAADLLVDGRWDYHEGYQVLQRIAQEEGLHTLGPRDPGHLELREGDGRHARSPGEPAWEGRGPRVAVPSRVADPGPAASVAQLDSFASAPARPARPAAPAFLASSPHFREQGAATASVRQERPSGAGIRSTLFLGHTGEGVPEGTGTTAGQEGRSGLVAGSWAQVAFEPQGAGARRTENVPRPEPADRLVSHQNLRDSAPSPSSGDPRRLAKAFGEAPTPVLGGAPDSAKGLGEGGTLGRRIDSAWVGGMPKPAEGLGEGGGAERTPRFEAGRMGGGGSPLPGEREVQAQAIPNLQGPLALSGLEGGIGEVGGRAESGGPLSVQRAFEVTEMREAGAPAGRLHLELEDLDGEGTRLRLALRGGRLDGVLELQDPLAAARVRLRVGELHEALLRHGLDGRNLVVRGPGENSETVGPARRGSATQEDSWFSKGGSPWQRERGKERGS